MTTPEKPIAAIQKACSMLDVPYPEYITIVKQTAICHWEGGRSLVDVICGPITDQLQKFLTGVEMRDLRKMREQMTQYIVTRQAREVGYAFTYDNRGWFVVNLPAYTKLEDLYV